MLIKEIKNPVLDSYLQLKSTVLDVNFPWFFTQTTYEEYGISILYHAIVTRPEEKYPLPIISSDYFELVLEIVKDIFEYNNIKPNCILRINLNCCLNMGGGFACDPHFDHEFKHKNIIVYLNSSHGPTVVCDKENDIEEYFHPKEDAIIQFEGLHYHYQPKVGERRVVLIVTYM